MHMSCAEDTYKTIRTHFKIAEKPRFQPEVTCAQTRQALANAVYCPLHFEAVCKDDKRNGAGIVTHLNRMCQEGRAADRKRGCAE